MEVSSSVAAGISIAANPGTTICKGTVVIFTANAVNGGALPLFQWYKNGVEVGGNSVTWSDIPADGDVVYCMLTSSLSCVAANPVTSAPLTFTAAPSPQVELTDKEFLCAGQLVMLDAGMGFSSYLWQDGSTDQYYSAIDEGQFYVTVTDALGCTGSDTVYFKKCGQMLYAPTAFSPNGDNLNDQFRLIGNIDNLSSFSMQVFNRWGELIFDANDIQKGWNGTQNGKYCQQDTYTWVVSYQVSSSSPDAKPVILKGTVTLIR